MSSTIPVTSKFSKEQNRNVFVWKPSNYGAMFFSWRVDERSPMTIKSMYRWIEALHQYSRNDGVPSILIYPADVERVHIAHHKAIVAGEVLPRESNNILCAGNYCMFAKVIDGGMVPLVYRHFRTDSYHSMEDEIHGYKWNVPGRLQEQTLARDSRSCYFTSDEKNVEVLWIIPPHAGHKLAQTLNERSKFHLKILEDKSICEQFAEVGNCLTMNRDIAKLFRENAIGVDVDDNYRIVCFDKYNHPTLQINARLALSDHSSSTRPADKYLKCHFVWCLIVQITNGDIKFEFAPHALDAYLRVDNDDPEKAKWAPDIAKLVDEYYSMLPQENDSD